MTTEEDRDQVYRLRYRVYVEELGKSIAKIQAIDGRLFDQYDTDAAILAIFVNGRAVGTVRRLGGGRPLPDFCIRYLTPVLLNTVPREQIGFSSRLIVDQSYRTSRVLEYLLKLSYEHAREDGVWIELIDCASSLIPLYEMLGFRRFRDGLVVTGLGDHYVPLLAVLDDVDYMRRVGCPFLQWAHAYPVDPSHARWFEEHFPEWTKPSTLRLLGQEQFHDFMESHINTLDSPLLAGLPREELELLLKAGIVFTVMTGQNLFRQDESGNEAYIVLSGAFEAVYTRPDGVARVEAIFGVGAVVGEISFLAGGTRRRTARATEDSKVVALTRESLDQMVVTNPKLAALLLLNFSRVLCERLSLANSR